MWSMAVGVTTSKVAVTCLALSRVTVQLAVPAHAPLQPAKAELPLGTWLSVTTVPLTDSAVQVVGQSMPTGELETLPLPVPASPTERVWLTTAAVALKVALMLAGALRVREQVVAVTPVQ